MNLDGVCELCEEGCHTCTYDYEHIGEIYEYVTAIY